MTAKGIKDEVAICRDRADELRTLSLDGPGPDGGMFLQGIAALYERRAAALEARLRPCGVWDAARPGLKF